MILDRIWAPGPESRLLPAEKLHAPTVAVMAIMSFAMIVVTAAGLALANAASVVTSGAESRFVIEIPAAQAPSLDKAVAAARSIRGARSVNPVSQEEMRETLKRWLGETAESPDLPIPAMATVELDRNADPKALDAAIRSQVPQATVSAESLQVAPMLKALRGLQWLALSLVVLMAAATAAAIVLAARGVLDTHRPTVEIMHGIGATDRQVTKLFERKIAVDAVAGAALGLVAAFAVLLLVGGGIAAAADQLATAVPLSLADMAVLLLVPVAAVVLALSVAHSTLLRALRSTL
jgi:cell division transport system permease protein